MANRLASATSPYLLQHAENPVDWWEWGEAAFAEARRRDVPLLVSIGYAACHWCHVMAHESFEDPDVAAAMNEAFVNVKVDREERPDVDAVYMEATQALTGHGGWPMTVFATPDGQPFFCGTYFPPQPRHGLPAFRQVLDAVRQAWRERRAEVGAAAAQITAQLADRAPSFGAAPPPGAADLDAAVDRLAADFDPRHGGFGGAPKFPPSTTLEFLLRRAARGGDGGAQALDLAGRTFAGMARGGIYDQLGGGFARYSVDAGWVVPHFEKMLYDNALLLRGYLHWWRATGDPLGRRVVPETADFLLRELRTPQGGFASSLDADSEGVEGRFYVWTPAQLREVLGPADAAWAAELYRVTEPGTFEHGASVLQLPRDPDDPDRAADVRRRLAAARERRVRPGRDDKVVAGWNGLAVAALAEAGVLLEEPRYLDAAVGAADLLLAVHLDGAAGQRLARVSRDGRAGPHRGVLEDHAGVAEGFLALYAASGEPAWLEVAGWLLDVVLARFAAPDGGFHDTADDAEALVRRPRDPTDTAAPSGWTGAASALLSYAGYTGSARHREAAERALGVVTRLAREHPRFVGWGLAVAEARLDGPREVAVVGEPDDPATTRLHRVALAGTAPGAVVAVGPPGGTDPAVPLLADRGCLDGRPTAYVCRSFVCDLPETDPAALARRLGARPPD